MDNSKYAGLETRLGTFYPKGFVVATFAKRDDFEAAQRELMSAGHPDVRAFEPQEVVERYQGQISKPLTRVADAVSETSRYAEEYVALAQQGHFFLLTKAENAGQVGAIEEVLRKHKGGNILHFGDWLVSEG